MNNTYKFSQFNFVDSVLTSDIIIFNCYSGAIIRVDLDTYDKIIYNRFNELSETTINDLLKRGIIVSRQLDENNKIKSQIRFEINNVLSSSANYVIAPTMKCNLHCYYCFENSYKLSHDYMSHDIADKVVDFIIGSLNSNFKRLDIGWFGGEPLLCYDTLIFIGTKIQSKIAKDIEFTSRITTNGILFTEERCKELVSRCGLKAAQITMDGLVDNYCKAKCAACTDYNSVIENIVKCAYLTKISVNYNATKDNIDDFLSLSKILLCDNNLRGKIRIVLSRVKPYNRDLLHDHLFSESEFIFVKEQLINKLQEMDMSQVDVATNLKRVRPCSVMRFNDGAIDPFGNLYKCEHFLGQEQRRLGDVINGWYYNHEYMSNSMGVEDVRCSSCCFYPICGFAICHELHQLVGSEEKCAYYDVMKFRSLALIKKYIGGEHNDSGA